MQLLIELLTFIQPYGTWSYVVIFAVLLACGFGVPIPEDITLVVGGILAARGIIDFNYCIVLCMAGVLVGDGTVFFLGRTMGNKVLSSRLGQYIMPEKRNAAVRRLVDKYGDKIIFMARFMPGLRTPLFFATGTYQVPYWKFLLLDGFAALISVPLWIYVGYLFGANLEELEKVIRKFQFGIYASIVAILILTIGYFYMKRRMLTKTNIP
ncbi:MAG: DedA family protein [Proteobacteria bacterium]|nr:DedA family protein [Pseudomonadota bacterium]